MTCLSKQKYQPGDVVLANCKPLIKVLERELEESRCDWCFEVNCFLKRCNGCKEMQYCDKKCQTQDWKGGHKLECKLSSFASICNNPNYLVLRIVLRIFAMLKLNPDKISEAFPLPDGSSRSFKDLLDHAETEDTLSIVVMTKLKSLMEGGGYQVNTEELLKFFSIHKTNGFSIYNREGTAKIGSGLYVQSSIFDHACKPNVLFITCGTEMYIRAIGPIEVGESICISYIATHMGRDDRRQTLKDRYHFDCECDRCTADSDIDINFQEVLDSIKVMNEQGMNPPTRKESFIFAFAMHKRILKMLRQMYHEYDDRITNQYTRMFQGMENYIEKLKKGDVVPLLNEVLDHVVITYGKDHFEYKMMRENLSAVGFGYLM